MKKFPPILWMVKKSLDLFVEGSLFWLPISLTVLLINHLTFSPISHAACLEMPLTKAANLFKSYAMEVALILFGMFLLERAISGTFLHLGVSDSWVDPTSFLMYAGLMVLEWRGED